MIVHGQDGMDEVSVTTDTVVSEVRDGKILHYSISPRDFGFELYAVDELEGGDAKKNAEIMRSILAGTENGAKRTAVLMNAGAAFYVSGVSGDMEEGIARARHVIDSGASMRKLKELVEAGKS
jgi:anthranilate phosphoribosyltransferase